MLSWETDIRGAAGVSLLCTTRSALVTTVSTEPALPVNLLTISIPDIDGDSIHEQGHAEQDGARRRRICLKGLIGTRDPVEHLDRHDRKRVEQPVKIEVRKLAAHRWGRQERDERQLADGDDRRRFADRARQAEDHARKDAAG